jgi:CubicO group peptidase (beta-lactamase class C family)
VIRDGIRIGGWVSPGFESVRAEFARNFTDRGDTGAAFAAVHDGELVVDLWGGVGEPEHGCPWREGTLAGIFSGTKGLVALCMHMLIDRGLLDVEAPVSRYWPEFAAHGKEGVLVAELMTHRARLPGVRTPISVQDLLDDVRMAALVASQAQESDPRAAFCYHGLTYGWLCGELVRRVDGRSMGRFFAEEVAEPLELDVWIGLPCELEPRVSRLLLAPTSGTDPSFDPSLWPDDELFQSAWGNPPLFREPLIWNLPAVHFAEIPGAGGIASARSLARLYGCLACGGALDGVHLLSAPTLARARAEKVRAHEPLTDQDMVVALGFMLQPPQLTLGPPPDAFGHNGAGGSRHGAWPSERVGFSYTMNQMRDDRDDPRGQSLLSALHSCLSERPRSPSIDKVT